MSEQPDPKPSKRSQHGLDWLNFFIADVRTGVGPFVAIYLANNKWNPTQVGMALTAAELAGVITQAPGGALTDRIPSKRLIVGVGLLLLTISALCIALFPNLPVVITAQSVLGITGSMFGPGISAITLGLIGYKCLGARTGRNAGFGSAGNVVAAVSMGLVGYYWSTKAIFFMVAILSVPSMISLLCIRGDEIDPERARGVDVDHLHGKPVKSPSLRELFCDRRLLIFAVLTIFFHLGNGAMLAQMGELMAKGREKQSALWMSAIVTVPQIIMALIGPSVGKIADAYGRKPILVFGFIFLPLRAVLCALTSNPYYYVGFQVFDGLAAGIFGIVGVLMIADLTRGSGRYNFALGTIGAAVGVGASISTTAAGFITTHYGFPAAFMSLALSGFIALLVLWLYMPETRSREEMASVRETENIGRVVA